MSSKPDTIITLDFPEGLIDFSIPDFIGAQNLTDVVRKIIPLSDMVVLKGIEIAAQFDKEISCKAGCGVCCCQMVPLSPPEAVIISNVIESLGPHDKEKLLETFEVGRKKLLDAGILPEIYNLYKSKASQDEVLALNKRYFEMNIPCPFLSQGSCSIYEFRPSRCREYNVLSDAKLCSTPFDAAIKRLPITIKLVEALTFAWSSLVKKPPVIIPLIDALFWVENNIENKEIVILGAGQFIKSVCEFACLQANKKAQRITK